MMQSLRRSGGSLVMTIPKAFIEQNQRLRSWSSCHKVFHSNCVDGAAKLMEFCRGAVSFSILPTDGKHWLGSRAAA